MKTAHLLIICGTVLLVAWLAFTPFRYQVHWATINEHVSCYYMDSLTGAEGVHHLPEAKYPLDDYRRYLTKPLPK